MSQPKESKQKKSSATTGDKLKDKIHRHLSDKNDIITEEDLRDILTDQPANEENNGDNTNDPA